ncbi:NAD kinase [Propionibacteriaceae bacterium Y1923]|uniref:NAD kinase n=1 Tax=Aestuariimicrobium sp. Y1814 TaxID=3418742 RepID=UPI003C1E7DE8
MGERRIAVMIHPVREEALVSAAEFISRMARHGVDTIVLPEQWELCARALPDLVDTPHLQPSADLSSNHVELVVVFGGDGTILRAAEWAYEPEVPLLGVNLGHVGFLAELDSSEVGHLVTHVTERSYDVEERLTLSVSVHDEHGRLAWESFAINEVSLEKGSRERMLEVLAHIDERPISRWAGDGVLVSTPTGSTAYAFSAGGPVMWPDVEAIELVPLSAHALFARPMVLSPRSRVDLDILPHNAGPAVLWCDGRRTFDLQPGSRVTVSRGPHDLLLARLTEQPFTTRLVKKFNLTIDGWRSPHGRSARGA